MAERRSFNKSERAALYLLSNGCCQICGDFLDGDWEPDHIQPFSKGGPTNILNAQASCKACNRAKGAKMALSWRPWQNEAYEHYQSINAQDYLIVACPGAGKTAVAVRIANTALANKVQQVVVVTPSIHLKTQWLQAGHRQSLNLNPDWAQYKGVVAPDFHGIIVTYQSLSQAAAQLMLPQLLKRRRTLVVFDEIHHAAEISTWGSAITNIFNSGDTVRLSLSGTPFRGDGKPIPFIQYENNEAQPDYRYTYRRAITDGVCKPIIFPSLEGEFDFVSSAGEMYLNTTFQEVLTEDKQSALLKAALSRVESEFVQQLLRDAVQQLQYIRDQGSPTAGGLIFAMNISHANEIADSLARITGNRPVIATSEDPDATTRIREFTVGADPWLVSVRMVSEGVDIPRLRVGVYATNYVSPLFFRQAVGRFVRMGEHESELTESYFFIPGDPRLREFAKEIEEERIYALRDMDAELEQMNRERSEPVHPSLFTPGDARYVGTNNIFQNISYEDAELRKAEDFIRSKGMYPDVKARTIVAALLRDNDIESGGGTSRHESAPLFTRKKMIRDILHSKVGLLNRLTGESHQSINYRLNVSTGVQSVAAADLNQLEARRQLIDDWIRTAAEVRESHE